MFILSLQKHRLRWVKIECAGQIPIPRYGHSAACVKNCIFVFGGRNDAHGINGLHDLAVFNVEYLKWLDVKAHGNLPMGRWGHCMHPYGNKILMLGGLNSASYMSSEVYELETDCADRLNMFN